jgi:hypothetical protein
MRWFRLHRPKVAALALVGLVFQFVLAFGHFHLDHIAGSNIAVAAIGGKTLATSADKVKAADLPGSPPHKAPPPLRRRLLRHLRQHGADRRSECACDPACNRFLRDITMVARRRAGGLDRTSLFQRPRSSVHGLTIVRVGCIVRTSCGAAGPCAFISSDDSGWSVECESHLVPFILWALRRPHGVRWR